ncbi:unnamed protein product [Adineta steineri]|uniref:F-box domain-containing protein n=1 Tax=Adineta steineri TaxID=433720 RepID=A0A819WNF4_9BILA|nr:unnamed protein product [Adineta steineri]CAF4127765.1 unnamed protein product [Adineta steineri]
MKFEQLPNEIFVECFQYLNAPDIFYSFDRLNYQFYILIRNVHLHLNFEQVKKSLFNEFCQTIRINPTIKRNIIYLKLSNIGTYGQIQSFISLFALNEFIHLRSLSFIDEVFHRTSQEQQQVSSILTLLPDLHRFYAPRWKIEAEVISKTKIQVLTLWMYRPTSIYGISAVTSLRVCYCTVPDLQSILNYTSMLKYIKIDSFQGYDMQYNIHYNMEYKMRCNADGSYKYDFSKICAVHLKQLHLDRSLTSFELIEQLLKCFPNLKIFSIVAINARNMIDANLWQHLIKSSLPLLRVFNFNFGCHYSDSYDNMLIKLSPFQTDFWRQHNWYINYAVGNEFTSVYTIPYSFTHYTLTTAMKKYNSPSTNGLNEFDNVKYLSLLAGAIRDDSSWHFRNVQSLSLASTRDYRVEDDEYEMKIENLKKMVNLSNITELEITERCVIKSELLFEILKQMPNISSLILKNQIISSFYINHELCELLNKKIKILYYTDPSWYHYTKIQDIDWFCKTFSNVEELHCDIDNVDDALLILTKCSKLSRIKVKCANISIYTWFEDNARTFNVYINYELKHDDPYDTTLSDSY